MWDEQFQILCNKCWHTKINIFILQQIINEFVNNNRCYFQIQFLLIEKLWISIITCKLIVIESRLLFLINATEYPWERKYMRNAFTSFWNALWGVAIPFSKNFYRQGDDNFTIMQSWLGISFVPRFTLRNKIIFIFH